MGDATGATFRGRRYAPQPQGAISAELAEWLATWELKLRADNMSPRTIGGYLATGRLFGRWLGVQAGTQADAVERVADITRDHLRRFIVSEIERTSASSTKTRFGALQALFSWLVEEEELATSPMAGLKPPKVREEPPPILNDEFIRALLKECAGHAFDDRRDLAIVRVLLDTGMRRKELAGLQVDDLDWTTNTARVVGKRNKVRACPFGMRAALALKAYLRVRTRHPHAASPALWLSVRGPLTHSGVYYLIGKRAKACGYAGVYPHLWRHRFAHAWLSEGGQERDLMRLVGWSSPTMLSRYGASAADERARKAHQLLSPGDRF